jgi:hypothetical protein
LIRHFETLNHEDRLANPRMPDLDCVNCAKPTKCCAFQPFIPNFLVGAWLESRKEGASAGLPPVMNAYWHPIGLIPAAAYRESHARTEGQDPNHACSFFKNRACSIYAFRPAECRTYFCEGDFYVREGQRAHDKEMALAQMALVECGLGAREIAAQVDVLSQGARENYTGSDLVFMYKKAWNWSRQISEQTVEQWIS